MNVIKYYSTLTDTLHENESDAQKAEDQYIEEYFQELDRAAASKRRKLKNLMQENRSPQVKRIIIR